MTLEVYLSDFLVDLNDYEISPNEISRGSFGSVKEGWKKEKDGKRGEHVAVKTLLEPATRQKEQVDLIRELHILAKLNHPSCLKLLGFVLPDKENDHTVIITQFMPNGTLEQALKAMTNGNPYPNFDATKQTCSLFGICSTMQFLHSQRIIHRDFKPANVFLNSDYEIVIADFGFSKLVEENADLTCNIGSPVFMAPELYSDDYDHITNAIDVYAFGVTLYLYFVSAPTELDDNKGKIRSHQHLMMRVMKGARLLRKPSIPDPIWNIIHQCFHADPEKRPTFSDLANMFETNENLWFEGTEKEKYLEYVQRIKDATQKGMGNDFVKAIIDPRPHPIEPQPKKEPKKHKGRNW
ncbi:hypothetical protein TRFO_41225 [Tritrichomonas foetus]|uniref:Protein kinase domain-containing protein n=1 Tax=Tritrichomonas foetus TaxID=1144522 RepID=A0A1J4L100_9EUKA|nr:hypothetical protein TRFO_41225 [Tritrichomonas foetus]|eukprot:OHT17193.1 hypothetical protein TRFO_41225 [Tritrichomonas foetus]